MPIIKKIYQFSWIFVSSLIIAEVSLRFIQTKRFDLSTLIYNGYLHLLTFHETRGWSYIPNFKLDTYTEEYFTQIETNSLGFRDDEIAEKNELATRIALIGDSFVSAIQVAKEKRFGEIIEQENMQGKLFDVLNFGIGGYGTYQELLVLEEIEKFKPDIVIISYYENDLLDNDHALQSLIKKNGHLKLHFRPFFDHWQNIRSKDFSDVLSLAKRNISQPKSILFHHINSFFTRDEIANVNNYISALNHTDEEITKKRRKALETTKTLFEKIKAQTAEAKLFVLLSPAIWEVNKDVQEQLRENYSKYHFDFNQHRNEIRKILSALSINYIDPINRFRDFNDLGRGTHFNEGHWNEFGHRIIAQEVAMALKAQFLIQTSQKNNITPKKIQKSMNIFQ